MISVTTLAALAPLEAPIIRTEDVAPTARFLDASCSQDRLVAARLVELLGGALVCANVLFCTEKAFVLNELKARQPVSKYTRRGMVDSR